MERQNQARKNPSSAVRGAGRGPKSLASAVRGAGRTLEGNKQDESEALVAPDRTESEEKEGPKQDHADIPAVPMNHGTSASQRTLVQAYCERVNLLSTFTVLAKGCRLVNITLE